MIPAAIVIGVIGGLLGPFFINVNTRVNVIRKKLLTKNYIKVIETTFFGFATASVFFMFPYIFGYCENFKSNKATRESHQKLAWCEDNPDDGIITSNPLASIFWASEGEIIINLMNQNFEINLISLFIFLLAWYV